MRHLPGQRNNINALTVVSGDSKWKKVIENQMETAKRNFQKSFAEISEKLQNSESVNHR